MKISGFTLIRNGIEFDYPFMESLQSLLPLVDELIINVGKGTDDTLKKLETWASSESKLKLFQSEWPLNDPEKKKKGIILSEQTNLALDRCQNDWCLYLQADEVLHEQDYPMILNAVKTATTDVEGILFDYTHFYGSYDIIQHSRSVYRREVRLIRKSSGARSVGDAQSFRKQNGEKLKVISIPAKIYHYGWVRTPDQMKKKTYFMDQLYHGDPTQSQTESETPHTGDNYRYKKFWGLCRYTQTHPPVMKERIKSKNWNWDFENSPFMWSYSDLFKVMLDLFERATGIRLFEYRSYDLK